MLKRRWLEMTWRDALFCHWPVEPAVVAETLPDRISVATHEGDADLGVVAFVMDDIRPRGAPVGISFPELNLRTYVEGPDGPGVYFYNLDADDRLGVAVARRLFALPYYRAEMEVSRPATVDPSGSAERVRGPVRFTSRPNDHRRLLRVRRLHPRQMARRPSRIAERRIVCHSKLEIRNWIVALLDHPVDHPLQPHLHALVRREDVGDPVVLQLPLLGRDDDPPEPRPADPGHVR